MRLIFRGDPNERASGAGWSRSRITMFGKTFELNGAPVDCSDLPADQRAKLAGHSHFEIVAADEPPAAEAAGAAGVAEEAPPAEASQRGQKRGTVKAKSAKE